MNTNIEITFHLAELITLVTIALAVLRVGARVMRTMGRIEGIFKDFPPHRHINGHIIYPEGFAPSEVGEMLARAAKGRA